MFTHKTILITGGTGSMGVAQEYMETIEDGRPASLPLARKCSIERFRQ
jgi:FlaA1/EpsC-like NDP-sugar epimerase